jgi:hypothetical protein
MDGHKGSGLENEQNFFAGGTCFKRGADVAARAIGLRLVQAAFNPTPDQLDKFARQNT